jgi:hypothetical protein
VVGEGDAGRRGTETATSEAVKRGLELRNRPYFGIALFRYGRGFFWGGAVEFFGVLGEGLDGVEGAGELGFIEAVFFGFGVEGIGEVFLVEDPGGLGCFVEVGVGEGDGEDGLDEGGVGAHEGFEAGAEFEGLGEGFFGEGGGLVVEEESAAGEGEEAALGLGGDGEDAAGADEDVVDVPGLLEFDGVEEVPIVVEVGFDDPGDEGFGLGTAPVEDALFAEVAEGFVEGEGEEGDGEHGGDGAEDAEEGVFLAKGHAEEDAAGGAEEGEEGGEEREEAVGFLFGPKGGVAVEDCHGSSRLEVMRGA